MTPEQYNQKYHAKSRADTLNDTLIYLTKEWAHYNNKLEDLIKEMDNTSEQVENFNRMILEVREQMKEERDKETSKKYALFDMGAKNE